MNNGNENITFGDSTTGPAADTRYYGEMNRVRIYNRAKSAQEICTAAGRVWSGTSCL
jgi:hypothetical protein